MIRDPRARGRALAALYETVEARLFADLGEAGVLPPVDDDADASRVRREWACFALYACVRGLIAAGGFNRETGDAVEALHEAALESWREREPGDEAERRRLLSERYAEYGAIGQAGGASAAATVGRRLGEAAAAHMVAKGIAPEGLAEMAGALHESLAEGAAEAVRRAE
jgi:hypothetical protein